MSHPPSLLHPETPPKSATSQGQAWGQAGILFGGGVSGGAGGGGLFGRESACCGGVGGR